MTNTRKITSHEWTGTLREWRYTLDIGKKITSHDHTHTWILVKIKHIGITIVNNATKKYNRMGKQTKIRWTRVSTTRIQ